VRKALNSIFYGTNTYNTKTFLTLLMGPPRRE